MLIGVLGAGQLGMMIAQAGARLGHSFRFLDPIADSPARVAGDLIVGDFTSTDALKRFAHKLDIVTWEFENVPCSAVQVLSRSVPTRPGIALLEIAQDRLSEKMAFSEIGLAPARHLPISSLADLRDAVGALGVSCILKTRRMGYDGKGQFLIRACEDVDAAWQKLGGAGDLILEALVDFEREVSLIACRSASGSAVRKDAGNVGGNGIAFYPMPTNVHKGGILRVSRAGEGAEIEPELELAARAAMAKLLGGVDYVGVMTIEFFVVRRADGGRALIANEMAPRVHNSGHWTIEGARTSQFENHCRAISGMELGSAALTHPAAAMVNIVGEAPDRAKIAGVKGATLHMYGKEPREGRKLGHITLVGSRAEVDSGLEALRGTPGTIIG
ncbi:MAG: 5-(carboxyamino)imidazole ribonucleotide synthase [Phycisphaeraceae bacterium]|nr:5-(carboxyamino)imidazole ribonucleotide synthase [Phycisphaeraceae bacterium]